MAIATVAIAKYTPLDAYFAFCIISSKIVTVVFIWIWTYKLVVRHRKAIQTTQTLNSQNCFKRLKKHQTEADVVLAITSIKSNEYLL
jgi:hypothetical protein